MFFFPFFFLSSRWNFSLESEPVSMWADFKNGLSYSPNLTRWNILHNPNCESPLKVLLNFFFVCFRRNSCQCVTTTEMGISVLYFDSHCGLTMHTHTVRVLNTFKLERIILLLEPGKKSKLRRNWWWMVNEDWFDASTVRKSDFIEVKRVLVKYSNNINSLALATRSSCISTVNTQNVIRYIYI